MMWRCASMNPAITVIPRASMVWVPACAAAAPAATDAIRPARTTSDPRSITWPLPTMMRALVMTRSCADTGAAAHAPINAAKETIVSSRLMSSILETALRLGLNAKARGIADALVEILDLVHRRANRVGDAAEQAVP